MKQDELQDDTLQVPMVEPDFQDDHAKRRGKLW